MSGVPSGPAIGTPGYATGPNPPNQQQRILASLTSALQNGVYVATATVSTTYFGSGHGLNVGETVYISKAVCPPTMAISLSPLCQTRRRSRTFCGATREDLQLLVTTDASGPQEQ